MRCRSSGSSGASTRATGGLPTRPLPGRAAPSAATAIAPWWCRRPDSRSAHPAGGTVRRRCAPRHSRRRSEEHTSELQSLMRISYAVFCLKKKNKIKRTQKLEPTYKRDDTDRIELKNQLKN